MDRIGSAFQISLIDYFIVGEWQQEKQKIEKSSKKDGEKFGGMV